MTAKSLKIKQFLQDGEFASLLDEVKNDIALEIIQTPINGHEQREELYMLTKAIDGLSKKLQEYVNNAENFQEI